MSEQLQELLNLETTPVAVTFHDAQPEDVSVSKRSKPPVAPIGDAPRKAKPSIPKRPTITTAR